MGNTLRKCTCVCVCGYRSNPLCILRPRHSLTPFTEFRTPSISTHTHTDTHSSTICIYVRSHGTHRMWRRRGQNFAQLKFKCCTNLCHALGEGSRNDGDNDDVDDYDDDDDDDRDNA